MRDARCAMRAKISPLPLRLPLPLDPDLAAFPDLLLPDRNGLLEGVDGEAAGLEGCGAVGAGDGDQDARLPNLEPADAVADGDAALPAADRLLRDLTHLPLRHRPVGVVLQVLHPPPPVMVPDVPTKRHHRP